VIAKARTKDESNVIAKARTKNESVTERAKEQYVPDYLI
jgi:hypothetical protein